MGRWLQEKERNKMPEEPEQETEKALKALEKKEKVVPSTVREETALLKRMKGGKEHGG